MSALKLCPTCGSEYPANERFCPRDGTALRAQGSALGDLVGSIIAERYHVIKKLGEGGMGQVYLAEHVKMGRKSAVKVMNPGMVNDSDAISRFNREAANASRINHPSVAGIYDFGETSEGLIYLAMEFIEGEALTDIVKASGALAPRRAADITRQAAEGLSVAHEMGIVHRDLKPDNIMIARNRDGSDCVKVVDFGIAKAQGNESQKVTRTGMVVGTPEYMSPEQLSGDKLDGRSDVYSLGLVTFNMLTGKLPFPSETAQESMIMRLTDKPRPLLEMNPGVAWSPEVQAVMDKALQRDAKLRYQTASEFGYALRDAVNDMPVSAVAEGGTLVMAPVPPTRVAGAATPAIPPTVEAPGKKPSRMPIFIGAGAIGVAAVAGLVFMMQSKVPSAAAVQTPSVQSPGLTTGAVPDSTRVATSSPATTPVTETRAPAPHVDPPVRGTVTPPVAEGAGPSIDDQMAAIDKRAESKGTARRALSEAEALRPKLTTARQRVNLAIIRAQAYGTLEEDANACVALRSVLSIAAGTSDETKLRGMLESCP